MTPASSPALHDPLPTAPELVNRARDLRLRMAVIDSETEAALDLRRDLRPYRPRGRRRSRTSPP